MCFPLIWCWVEASEKQNGSVPDLAHGSALVLSLTKASKGMPMLVLARNQFEDKSVERESIWGSRFKSIINDFWIINHSSWVVDYWGETKGLCWIIKELWREWRWGTLSWQSEPEWPMVSRRWTGQRAVFPLQASFLPAVPAVLSKWGPIWTCYMSVMAYAN